MARTRTRQALVCMLLLGLLHGTGLYVLVTLLSSSSLLTPTHTYTSHYERLSKAEVQQSLVIVSDMTSHFGRAVAVQLADMGFYVLAGVRSETGKPTAGTTPSKVYVCSE